MSFRFCGENDAVPAEIGSRISFWICWPALAASCVRGLTRRTRVAARRWRRERWRQRLSTSALCWRACSRQQRHSDGGDLQDITTSTWVDGAARSVINRRHRAYFTHSDRQPSSQSTAVPAARETCQRHVWIKSRKGLTRNVTCRHRNRSSIAQRYLWALALEPAKTICNIFTHFSAVFLRFTVRRHV